MTFSKKIAAFVLAALCVLSALAEDAAAKPEETEPSETTIGAAATKPVTTPITSATHVAPKFPIVSENFKTIEDGNDHPEDGLPDAANLNAASLLDVIAALEASTQQDLAANVDPKAEFRKIFNHPDNFRGHVVRFESTMKFLYDHSQTITDEQGRVYTLTRGHVTSSWQLVTFLSLEPLPPDIKIGDPVLITGVFLQRFAYVNRKKPGKEVTWTPLIIVKKVEPFVVVEAPPTSPLWLVFDVVCGLIAVGLIIAFGYRESGRTARRNIFTRLKVQRDGADRQFPGPRPSGKKK